MKVYQEDKELGGSKDYVNVAKWIAGMLMADVLHKIEEFCGVFFTSLDEHVDVEKFSNWFESLDPFL